MEKYNSCYPAYLAIKSKQPGILNMGFLSEYLAMGVKEIGLYLSRPEISENTTILECNVLLSDWMLFLADFPYNMCGSP